MVRDRMVNIDPTDPLISVAVSVNVLAGITGRQSHADIFGIAVSIPVVATILVAVPGSIGA